MNKLRLCTALTLLIATSGCEKAAPKRPVTATKPAAPISQWALESIKDAMTDRSQFILTTTDPATDAKLMIFCNDGDDTYEFSSDLFLGVAETYGDMEYRLDDEEVTKAKAFFSKMIAILGAPVRPGEWMKTSGDKFMTALNGMELGTELTTKPHSRLRVRLRSFDGDQRDLDFNITGVQEEIKQLHRSCGKKV